MQIILRVWGDLQNIHSKPCWRWEEVSKKCPENFFYSGEIVEKIIWKTFKPFIEVCCKFQIHFIFIPHPFHIEFTSISHWVFGYCSCSQNIVACVVDMVCISWSRMYWSVAKISGGGWLWGWAGMAWEAALIGSIDHKVWETHITFHFNIAAFCFLHFYTLYGMRNNCVSNFIFWGISSYQIKLESFACSLFWFVCLLVWKTNLHGRHISSSLRYHYLCNFCSMFRAR